MEGNPKWRGGKHTNWAGYIVVYTADRGRVFEHRLVMEAMIGRQLTPAEIVHHKNHIRNDNRPENLQLTNRQEHHGIIHRAEAMANLSKTPTHIQFNLRNS